MSETQTSWQPPVEDGRVEARGSVWKIHFQGDTLDEVEVATALKALGVVKVERAVTTGLARVTPTIH